MKQKRKKFIGPISVIPPKDAEPYIRIEDYEDPFVVDRNCQNQQRLAAKVGWKRLEEIEEQERQAWEEAKLL